jgi:hypothetical protein
MREPFLRTERQYRQFIRNPSEYRARFRSKQVTVWRSTNDPESKTEFRALKWLNSSTEGILHRRMRVQTKCVIISLLTRQPGRKQMEKLTTVGYKFLHEGAKQSVVPKGPATLSARRRQNRQFRNFRRGITPRTAETLAGSPLNLKAICGRHLICARRKTRSV